MVTFYANTSTLDKLSGFDPFGRGSLFDLLAKNFYDKDSEFLPVVEAKVGHPVDIYETKQGLHLDIACTGIDKQDIEVNVEGDILRVKYERPKEESNPDIIYQQRGITRKSFNLGWKLASRFDLSNANAKFENGLLEITVPFAEAAKPKTLKIK